MRRILLAASAAIFFCWAVNALAGAFPDGPGGPTITIENTSTVVSKAELAGDLPYLQQYLGQVCEAWHCAGTIRVARKAGPRDWIFHLADTDKGGKCGCYGYHDVERSGRVFAWIYAKDANLTDPLRWTYTFTHELAEALGDPTGRGVEWVKGSSNTGADWEFYWQELCDPVDGYSYALGPITAADFVYRNWFLAGAKGPYDATRSLSAPLELAPQGYIGAYIDGRPKMVYAAGAAVELPHEHRH